MTFLERLSSKITSHKKRESDDSYVAFLNKAGLNKILEKVGEEAIELIIAAKEGDQPKNKKELVKETADLWFHSLVALAKLGERPEAVVNELARRFNMSGLEEKASRTKK